MSEDNPPASPSHGPSMLSWQFGYVEEGRAIPPRYEGRRRSAQRLRRLFDNAWMLLVALLIDLACGRDDFLDYGMDGFFSGPVVYKAGAQSEFIMDRRVG